MSPILVECSEDSPEDRDRLVGVGYDLAKALASDDAVERAAKAMCVADGDDWNREGPGGLDSYRSLALAALSALLSDVLGEE